MYRHHRLSRDEGGVAVIEFALVAPLLLLILCGTLAYAGYFWMAHSIQQVANDAARAALAGLTASERLAIAQTVVSTELPKMGGLSVDRAAVSITSTSDMMTVQVNYDSGQTAFAKLPFVPLADSVIRRTAVVHLGGF